MKKLRGAFLGILLLAMAVGCGAGRTMVMNPPDRKTVAAGVEIVRGESTVVVPEEVVVRFEEQLKKRLFEAENGKEAPFAKGTDLKLEYRFIQFNKGNQFSRYMWGGLGNSGEGNLTVSVCYRDSEDRELCTIQSEGKIGSGFFGGSISSAVDRCADEIAGYTAANFR